VDRKLTGGHDKMDFRLGHDVNVRSYQASRFALTDERRRSRNYSLSARHVHSLEKEPSEVLDDPLHNAEIIQHLHKRNEENDSAKLSRSVREKCVRNVISYAPITYHIDKEPVLRVNSILVKEESRSDEPLSEEVGCEGRKPLEQVEAGARLEHEEGYRLLDEQTNNDNPPLYVRSVSRCRPKPELENKQT
jgi:hypothetical protein